MTEAKDDLDARHAAACADVARSRANLRAAEAVLRAVEDKMRETRGEVVRRRPTVEEVVLVATSVEGGMTASLLRDLLCVRGYHENEAARAMRLALEKGLLVPDSSMRWVLPEPRTAASVPG